MAKQIAKDKEMVTVVRIFKDKSMGEDTFAPAFGYEAIELPASVLKENGTVVDKNNPDIFPIFQSTLMDWCYRFLGL